MDVQQEFWRRVNEEWLPAFCNDPKRCHLTEGFLSDSGVIGAYDARNFLRAIDHKVVIDKGGGRYSAARSKALEFIFKEGEKKITPRPLWVLPEPVITIGAVGRLHFDFGWPVECLGMQSVGWAFDLIAFKPNDLVNEHIAGEVKATSRELDRFLENLRECCAAGQHDCLSDETVKRPRINAHKKWLGLKRCRAPVLWALGPGGDGRVFDVLYNESGTIDLNIASEEKLTFN